MRVVVVVLMAQIGVVGELAVAYAALNLHPALGEGYVLEVDEADADHRYGPCIGALHQVARREFVADNHRVLIFHAGGEEYSAILDVGVELLHVYRSRTCAARCPCPVMTSAPAPQLKRRLRSSSRWASRSSVIWFLATVRP